MSSTVGYVLILGMVVIGMTSVVALGSVALEDTERQSTLERAEQSMAQFDSRAAQVALGAESLQELSLGHSSGNYQVVEGEGTITVTHVNHDGDDSDGDDDKTDDGNYDDDEDIYSGPLGAVVYQNGDTEIAYQGGGVWRHQDGNTQMVSPPEFHYEGSTLTLPVVTVTGEDSASGSPTAVVERATSTETIYPNSNTDYVDNSTKQYTNPASNGQIIVTIQSEYYQGWEEYFNSRTEGSVIDVDHGAETVTAELITLGHQGEFNLPSEDNPFQVRGLEPSMQDGDGLKDLAVTLRPIDRTQDHFSSLDWSMYVHSGGQEMEINLKMQGSGGCGDAADLTIYYHDGGETYQGWHAENAYTVDCSGSTPKIELDLIGDSTPSMNYESVTASNLVASNPNSISLQDPVVFDHFEGDNADVTYTVGSDASADLIIRHYFNHFAPTFDLRSTDGNHGNSVNEPSSNGNNIIYTGSDVITYLHVSENEVKVRFE